MAGIPIVAAFAAFTIGSAAWSALMLRMSEKNRGDVMTVDYKGPSNPRPETNVNTKSTAEDAPTDDAYWTEYTARYYEQTKQRLSDDRVEPDPQDTGPVEEDKSSYFPMLPAESYKTSESNSLLFDIFGCVDHVYASTQLSEALSSGTLFNDLYVSVSAGMAGRVGRMIENVGLEVAINAVNEKLSPTSTNPSFRFIMFFLERGIPGRTLRDVLSYIDSTSTTFTNSSYNYLCPMNPLNSGIQIMVDRLYTAEAATTRVVVSDKFKVSANSRKSYFDDTYAVEGQIGWIALHSDESSAWDLRGSHIRHVFKDR